MLRVISTLYLSGSIFLRISVLLLFYFSPGKYYLQTIVWLLGMVFAIELVLIPEMSSDLGEWDNLPFKFKTTGF